MIWFFLAGFVAGAVGIFLYAGHVARREEDQLELEVRDMPGAEGTARGLEPCCLDDSEMRQKFANLTEQVIDWRYLNNDEILKILAIYDGAMERRKQLLTQMEKNLKEGKVIDRSGI